MDLKEEIQLQKEKYGKTLEYKESEIDRLKKVL